MDMIVWFGKSNLVPHDVVNDSFELFSFVVKELDKISEWNDLQADFYTLKNSINTEFLICRHFVKGLILI